MGQRFISVGLPQRRSSSFITSQRTGRGPAIAGTWLAMNATTLAIAVPFGAWRLVLPLKSVAQAELCT
jgi:hypothetical protein